MILFLNLTSTAIAPWVVIGLVMVSMIVAGVAAVGKKANKKDIVFKDTCTTTTKALITENKSMWEEIRISRKDITLLIETRGEMKAYVNQLREMVAEIKKLNGK